MKLFLSSYRIPDLETFTTFVGKSADQISIGLISNAKDYKTATARAEKMAEVNEYFNERGFSTKEINLLADSFSVSSLKKHNVLWLLGGNVYWLRDAIKKSGTREVITDAIKSGVIYAGDSAGAIMAGSTLKHFHEPSDPPIDQQQFDGLGLVHFTVVPHWQSAEYGEFSEKSDARLRADGYDTVRLKDNGFLCVKDGDILDQSQHE